MVSLSVNQNDWFYGIVNSVIITGGYRAFVPFALRTLLIKIMSYGQNQTQPPSHKEATGTSIVNYIVLIEDVEEGGRFISLHLAPGTVALTHQA